MRISALRCVLLLGSLLLGASGAGMNTHTEVGYRAAKWFGMVGDASPNASAYNAAIQSNIEAVHGGSDFPDFLYACGTYSDHHDAGEAAHWPPFQAAAIKYIRALPDFLPDPATGVAHWSDNTTKLVAFFFGVSVHYIADEMWEGLNDQLGRGQGFVRALSSFNLGHDGLSDNDEGPANMAADFWIALGMSEKDIHPWERYFPVEALTTIYHQAGFPDVTLESLSNCRALFDLGLWAEKTFGPALYAPYAEVLNALPLAAERVLDLPIGGVDDMAVWANWVWQRTARWLDEGPPASPPPNRRLLAGRKGGKPTEEWAVRLMHAFSALSAADVAALRSLSDAEARGALGPRTARDGSHAGGLRHVHVPTLALGDARRGALERALAALVDAVAAHSGLQEGDARYVAFKAATAIAPPPAGLAAIAAAAEADLAAAAELVRGRAARQGAAQTPSVTATGDAPVGYLGSALASGDFDGDGTADLAAGAYGGGTAGAPQVGSVQITYAAGAGTAGATSLGGALPHSRFGRALAVLDFNQDGVDDLAVGAPAASWQPDERVVPDDTFPSVRVWGAVYVHLGQKGVGLSAEAALTITTKDDLTALGQVLAVGDVDGDGFDDLLLGCPFSSFVVNASIPREQSVNRGAAFAVLSKAVSPAQRYGGGDGGGLAASIDVRVGADVVVEGPAGYGWFGQALAVGSAGAHKSVLLVGAPGYRDLALANITTVGRLYAYDAAATAAAAGKAPAIPLFSITGEEPLAEFGAALATSGEWLAVASPAAGAKDNDSLRAGEVRLLNLTLALAAGNAHASEVPTAALLKAGGEGLLHDSLKRSRFGRTLAFADVDADGRADLLAGAPLANGGFLSFLGEHAEAGAAFAWSGAALPTGTVTDIRKSAKWSMSGTRARARFGSALAVGVGGNCLAVGSPYADGDSDDLTMAGAIDTVHPF